MPTKHRERMVEAGLAHPHHSQTSPPPPKPAPKKAPAKKK